MKMLKSYMFDSVYRWILDSNYTPYILVDAGSDRVSVPREFVRDNRIILNVHPRSIEGFIANDDGLNFMARFSGQSRPVVVPADCLIAIYARETNQGIVFQGESVAAEMISDLLPVSSPVSAKHQRPQLKLVK